MLGREGPAVNVRGPKHENLKDCSYSISVSTRPIDHNSLANDLGQRDKWIAPPAGVLRIIPIIAQNKDPALRYPKRSEMVLSIAYPADTIMLPPSIRLRKSRSIEDDLISNDLNQVTLKGNNPLHDSLLEVLTFRCRLKLPVKNDYVSTSRF